MKKLPENLSVETLAIHGGFEIEEGQPEVFPLVQSTGYRYDTADKLAALFDLEEEGYFYSRLANPTVDNLEHKLAQLEKGVGAVATSSGQGATLLAILNLCEAGDHIVAMNNIYGGSRNLFTHTLAPYGIDVTYVDNNTSDEELSSAIQENTKLVWGEMIGNPGGEVLDITRVSNIAHEHNIPLIVDSTFATPYLCRPFEFGADIVVHSTSKYIDGHGTCVGGVVIDSGNFDWSKGNYPGLNNPVAAYHGLSFTEEFGELAYITRAKTIFIRDFGNGMAPFNAFLTNLGVETLALRMEKHSSNGLQVAKYLENHPKVEWVKYPFLKSSPDYKLAKKYLKGGAGVVSFGIKGGEEAGKKFIEGLNIGSIVIHVGEIRTIALHPASTTHRQLSEEELQAAGVPNNLIRLSVGIENIDEIIADIEQSLERV